MSEWIKEPEVQKNIINSLILFSFILITRFIAVKSINRSRLESSEHRRQWLVQINNLVTIILVLGLVVVWAKELQAFAISVMALGAAIVLATKEMILCFMGGVYKSMNRIFRVGDRIEVAGYRGEVIDHNFFMTEIVEIGPGRNIHQYSGKTIEIPNSLFLSHGVIKESRQAKFRLHSFSIIQPLEIDIEEAKRSLLESANRVCANYIDDAKKFLEFVEKKEGIEAPSTQPRISIVLQSKDSVEFVVRVPIPFMRAGKIEQEIINKFVKIQREKTQATQ